MFVNKDRVDLRSAASTSACAHVCPVRTKLDDSKFELHSRLVDRDRCVDTQYVRPSTSHCSWLGRAQTKDKPALSIYDPMDLTEMERNSEISYLKKDLTSYFVSTPHPRARQINIYKGSSLKRDSGTADRLRLGTYNKNSWQEWQEFLEW